MKQQAGSTLLIALIMLVLMTLAALTSFNMGRSNLQVVGNQQHRSEAEASAKAALEEILSKAAFSETPSTPFGNTNTKSYDINADGTNDIVVTVGTTGSTTNPPPCIKSFRITLDPTDLTYAGCASSVQQQFGVEGASTAGMSCAAVVWEVTAVATDATTQSSVTAVQGIRVSQDASTVTTTTNYCP